MKGRKGAISNLLYHGKRGVERDAYRPLLKRLVRGGGSKKHQI